MKHSRLIWFLLAVTGCSDISFTKSDNYPEIFPDYIGVTIPEGLADLNFKMCDGSNFEVTKKVQNDTIWVTVSARGKGARTGIEYAPFPVYISHDPIDPYIAYRLIEPGYESWNEIEIRQRDLGSFKETPIVTNHVNNKGCVNCHSFDAGRPDRFLFHARGAGGGTVFVDGDNVTLVNLAGTGPGKQGTYPQWHPGGRYVAFSSNTTNQGFTINDRQPIEVYDTASDLIIYDTETGTVLADPRFCTEDILETFPGWSGDGRTLYYCAAKNVKDIGNNRGEVHYKLMAVDFEDGHFQGEPRTVWEDSSASASFPRIFGNWMLFTKSSFGTFPIWHREADLWLLDLNSGETFAAEALNSPDTESYHSWSSNGRWVVFSSRRIDGRYTRLFISHFDGNGNFTKPFLLPQKNPEFNTLRLKSYNIPEFIRAEVADRQQEIKKLFK